MNNNKTLIFVGAHPDDETLSVGATLAQYSANGVKVHYVCATRGEAGNVYSSFTKNNNTVADIRSAELECASTILGLEGVIYLGYYDSGISGSNGNSLQALSSVPVQHIAEKIIKIIRELKPEVIVTCDPIGGYRHPDHIAVHNASVMAFNLSGDAGSYPESGPAYRPQKLYFSVFRRRLLKLAVKILPLMGQDPRYMGRNRNIDLTKIASVVYPVDAVIRLSKHALEDREKAIACYTSQIGPAPRGRGLRALICDEAAALYASQIGSIPRYQSRLAPLLKRIEKHDLFMRAFPLHDSGHIEGDLFEGILPR